MVSNVDLAHMHLIGNDTVVKLNLPESSFFPIDLSISFPDDLNLWMSSVL